MRRVHLTFWLAALGACGDAPTGPATGTLEITTVTTGDRVDPDGYVVALDGDGKPIGSNATLMLSDVAPGEHELELQGLAAECAIAGSNPRPVTVESGIRGRVTLQISCLAAIGSIALRTRTAGANPDLDGDMLSAWCATLIPKYMIPESFVFANVLPKTSTGKIDRQALQKTG